MQIKVTYQNAKGKTVTKKFRDWEARIFQHEYDHLDGVLYMDRLLPESRQKVSDGIGMRKGPNPLVLTFGCTRHLRYNRCWTSWWRTLGPGVLCKCQRGLG